LAFVKNNLQILDKGSQPLSNFEVLAHINSLESKYESQNRTKTIPENVHKAMRDVREPFHSLAMSHILL
jgi:hypothetical protein